MSRKNAVAEWVDSNFVADMPPTAVVLDPTASKATLQDSSWDLKKGLDVAELDTIPAELMELFK